nr:unnamed protein product [Spirometra erinaceieuropaei]
MLLPMEEYVKKFEAYMKSGSRHAIYPWTVTARIRQFPYLWYYRNNHFVRWYVLTMPIFKKLTTVYDPFNPNEIPIEKLHDH